MGFILSPASVRNVMADLEEMGYVRQPHTSAGRVPTETGYRLYVNALMERQEIEREKQQMVDEVYKSKIKEIEEIMELSSKLLSLLSNYTAVVQTPAMDVETIKHVNLVALSSRKIVVVLVSSNGNIIKRVAILSRKIKDSEVDRLNTFLNEKMCSLSFAAARSVIESLEDSTAPADRNLIGFAREIMDEALAEDERDIYLDGMENIFDQPEFKDLNRLRPVIRVLDEKKHLNDVLGYCIPEDDVKGVCIRIGSENKLDDVKSCSVVVSPYRIGGCTRGAIGVIGPTRMQYSRASSVVGFMADKLGHVLTEMCRG
jgi:heat-inducible transcriptional repressor